MAVEADIHVSAEDDYDPRVDKSFPHFAIVTKDGFNWWRSECPCGWKTIRTSQQWIPDAESQIRDAAKHHNDWSKAGVI